MINNDKKLYQSQLIVGRGLLNPLFYKDPTLATFPTSIFVLPPPPTPILCTVSLFVLYLVSLVDGMITPHINVLIY